VNGYRVPWSGGNRSRVGIRFFGSLGPVEVEFGVCELLETLDLRGSVIVGDEVRDVNRLAVHVMSERAFHFGGGLSMRTYCREWMRG
jgi:hypothetical protein